MSEVSGTQYGGLLGSEPHFTLIEDFGRCLRLCLSCYCCMESNRNRIQRLRRVWIGESKKNSTFCAHQLQ